MSLEDQIRTNPAQAVTLLQSIFPQVSTAKATAIISIIVNDTKKRNFQGIQHANVRILVDPFFCKLADQLDNAFYNNWNLGNSKPWQGYDVLATPDLSKQQFDTLTGAIWHLHTLAKVAVNSILPTQYQMDVDSLNPPTSYVLDSNGNPTSTVATRASDDANTWLANCGLDLTKPRQQLSTLMGTTI